MGNNVIGNDVRQINIDTKMGEFRNPIFAHSVLFVFKIQLLILITSIFVSLET